MAENPQTDPTLSRPESLAAARAVPVGMDRPVNDPEHLLPEHTSRGEPGQVAMDDPDTARAEIGRTRARMSATLDGIEAALVRRKEQIRERLDVMAPVKQRPLLSVGVVFGAALLLGYATGGDDDDEEHGRAAMAAGAALMTTGLREEAATQAGAWERRARRLRKRSREQQEELKDLRGHVGDDLEDGLHALGTGASHLRDAVTESIADLLTAAFDRMRDGAERVRDASAPVLERVGGRLDDLKGAAGDVVETVRDAAGDAVEVVKDRVEALRD
jgi:ElaB/YqjD/DUF883 family membrane-anchored ribosome-binding protein